MYFYIITFRCFLLDNFCFTFVSVVPFLDVFLAGRRTAAARSTASAAARGIPCADVAARWVLVSVVPGVAGTELL